jgi:MerR family copper efflux transcriptional regulator
VENVLISEFVRATGLTVDTVRFYIRLGLLRPETGTKGGANPYQVFTAEHVDVARIIRLAQSLGFSLSEIATLNDEHRQGKITNQRSIEIMSQQLARLEEKAGQLNAMMAYIRAKLEWLEGGGEGPEPRFPGVGRQSAAERLKGGRSMAPGVKPR